MKRPAEKTFGPSPEWIPPAKRQKSQSRPRKRSQQSSKDVIGSSAQSDNDCSHTEQKSTPKTERQSNRSAKAVDDKIIVGVDFGTTFSGLCWAHTVLPDTQTAITQWPDSISDSLEGTNSEKVPTELQYLEQDYAWGFQIPDDAKRYQWFKLKLAHKMPEAEPSLFLDFPEDDAGSPGNVEQPETLVKDYLLALRKHIQAVFAKSLPPSISATAPVEYVLTVPALWSDAAIAKTRSCAERAGMGKGPTLTIVPEPEAAAVYALRQMTPYNLSIGDTLVVCDAGGGTVDLISYRITALKPVLRVTEAAPGRGGYCGSTSLNRRFKSFLRSKLSSHPLWREDMLDEALSRFDLQIKRKFNGSATRTYQIPIPGILESEAHDISNARYCLKGSDLLDVFEPVIEEILTLVSGQIDATEAGKGVVKAVLLVGGFGESSYLGERVRQACLPRHVAVWKPPHAWTAVVRGAVMKGLSEAGLKGSGPHIMGRVARKNIGTESAKAFDKIVHPVEQRIWSAPNNRYEVNTFDWFVVKGDTVSEKKPIRLRYHSEHQVPADHLGNIKVTIVKCTDSENIGPPQFADGSRVETIAHLQVPLTRIPMKSLKTRLCKDGKEYYIVDFALSVTCYGSETIYDLIHNRQNYGRVSAEYV